MRHGAEVKIKLCSKEGCKNKVVKGGVCYRHGAKRKQCSSEGCSNQVLKGGVCMKHGAEVKRCSHEGCANIAVRGGVCKRHGTHRNTNDESTAFELKQTTADRSQHSVRASIPSIIRKDAAQGVPKEVAILCQEIFEV